MRHPRRWIAIALLSRAALADEPAPPNYQSTARAPALPRTGSDYLLDGDLLSAAPAATAGDLLGKAPGLYVARPEGEAVGQNIYLRGSDAEQGQDVELSLGPVPLNQPSHIHGHGYADLGLIIPEVVRSLRVVEGNYDPRQGDFAVAGSATFDLGVAERGFLSRTSYGSFDSFRQLMVWAPAGRPEETFVAVALRGTDGFGAGRAGLSATGIAQDAFRIGSVRGLFHAAFHSGRSQLAGVLRLDDVDAGRAGFYDRYPGAAADQYAVSLRAQAALTLDRSGDGGANTNFTLWLSYTLFHLRENFTGYTEDDGGPGDPRGTGDLTDQVNHDFSVGGQLSQRTRRFLPAPWTSLQVEAGASYRLNVIDQMQSLAQSPLDPSIDDAARIMDAGIYLDLDWRIARRFRVRGGVRADVLYFDVDDHVASSNRTAAGFAWGPRLTVEATPSDWATIHFAYGEGFRSASALQLDSRSAPFARVRSAEGGLQLSLLAHRLTVGAVIFDSFLTRDFSFDPDELRTVETGSTQFPGGALRLTARPWPWAIASLSATYVHATLIGGPDQSSAALFPPNGLLPNAPPFVLRADLGARHAIGRLGGQTVDGRIGLGLTLLSPRPLPDGESSATVALIDLSASLRRGPLEVGVEMFNLLDARYGTVEYIFVSDWHTSPATNLPARHFAAGAPRTVLGTLSFHL